MLVLTILTGSIGWNYRDRAARQTAVEQEVNLALKEAEQWQQQEKWPEALSAAKQAQGLLVGGGSDGIRDRTTNSAKTWKWSSVWKRSRFFRANSRTTRLIGKQRTGRMRTRFAITGLTSLTWTTQRRIRRGREWPSRWRRLWIIGTR